MGFLADIGRAKPVEQIQGFLQREQDREIGEQTLRANEIKIKQAQEQEALANQRLSFNSLRSMTPDMTDKQYEHLLGVAQAKGYDLTDDSIRRKDLQDFFTNLQSPEGKNIMVQNTQIGLNDVRQKLKELETGVQSGEIKMKPEELQAQKQKLIDRENVLINSKQALGIKEGTTNLPAGKQIGNTFELKKGDVIETHEVIGVNEDGTAKTRIIATAPRLASETGTELSPEALDIASLSLLESGNMPSVGRSAKARVQILNNASKVAREYGLEPKNLSLAGKKMVYDASKKALADLTSRKSQILAFEETANLNLDIVKELSGKVDRTGVPVVNAWINAGRRAVTGNVELSRFDAAVRVAINEVAKITSSATGGAVTSDTARKEFEDLLKTAQTPEQVMGVVDVLQRDMSNRITGFETQTEELNESIRMFNPKNKSGKSAEEEAEDFLKGK